MSRALSLPKQELINYYAKGYSIKQLADKYQCSTGAVYAALIRLNVKIRPAGRKPKSPEDFPAICKEYQAGATLHELASKYNCSIGKVRYVLVKANVKRRPPGANSHKTGAKSYKNTLVRSICNMYREGKNIISIANDIGRSGYYVHKILCDNNIPRRKQGRNCKHTTEKLSSMYRLYKAEGSYAKVARHYGISRQRIHMLIKRYLEQENAS